VTRQEQILAAIADHWREHGSAPSLREVAQVLGGGSASTVLRELDVLKAAGLVTYRERDGRMLPRTLRLVERETSGT
jgi:DNA-binding transcriptional ArsR family regulator